MRRYAEGLSRLGIVTVFDYPYMQAKRRAPDRLPVLIDAHRRELEQLRALTPGRPVVLAGKSMGSRVSCHVALTEHVAGVVCFGYPLRSQTGTLRDAVLLELRRPILFVQGTRDALCPLDELDGVRGRMRARNELFIVEGGDHSLSVSKTVLKQGGRSQDGVELEIFEAVQRFTASLEHASL